MNDLLERGVFVISIDAEMSWGVIHRGDRAPQHYTYRDERRIIDRLLTLFEKHETRATWAVVGHLFLDHCEPIEGHKHPEIVRPPYSWFQGDWFDTDPCSEVDRAPSWYGRDIVGRIRQCKVPQEIGSHSFSHIIVGDPECTAESFDSDLRACRQLADAAGVTLRSFVFPRNTVGHLDTLARNGFAVYRGRTPRQFRQFPKYCRPVLHVTHKAWPLRGAVTFPIQRGSLWDIPGTCSYSPSTSRWRFLPLGQRLQRIKSQQRIKCQLRAAAQYKGLVHLSFHPHNLTSEPDTAIKGLDKILQIVGPMREKGKLENLTMGELAEALNRRVRASAPVGTR